MINCAHPTHFEHVLEARGASACAGCARTHRRAATPSSTSAEDLDDGDPQDLGARYAALRASSPALNVVGGCCGTDHRHVGEICSAWLSPSPH